jgi:lipocalin
MSASRPMKRSVDMLGAFVMSAGCASRATERLRLPHLRTITHVELSRYRGTWYETASFPRRFQRGCTAATARYTIRADGGDIDVVTRLVRTLQVSVPPAAGGAQAPERS